MNPSISDIKTATCAYYTGTRITRDELEGPARDRRIAYPRQVSMYLARALTTHSLSRIGQHFGSRDHSTVYYALRSVEERPSCLSDAENIRRLLEARTSPRSALAMELAACREIVEFIRSLPPMPGERDWLLLETAE